MHEGMLSAARWYNRSVRHYADFQLQVDYKACVRSVALPDRDRSLVALALICTGTRSGADSSAIDH